MRRLLGFYEGGVIPLINIFLRVSGIGLKFFLVTYLISRFDIATFGRYSLIYSTITILIYIIGLDYYTHYSRVLITETDKSIWSRYISSIFLFYLFTFSIASVFFWIMLLEYKVPQSYYTLVILILLFEFYSQELYRILILLGKSLSANVSVFFRNALWIPIFISFDKLQGENQGDLTYVFSFWMVGSLISFTFAAGVVSRDVRIFKVNGFVPIEKIKEGLRISLIFFLGTLLLRSIYFVDKIILKYFSGEEEVGIYSFFLNVASVSLTLVDVGIIGVFLPRLIDLSDIKTYNHEFRKVSVKISILSVLVAVVTLLSFDIIISFTGNNNGQLSRERVAFNLLIIGTLFQNLSNIPHYFLYARKQDNYLLVTTVASVFVFIIAGVALTFKYGIVGLSSSYLICFFLIFVNKSFIMYKNIK